MSKDIKNNKIKKIISSVLIVSMVLISTPLRPAQAWIPGVDPMIKQGLEEMAEAIKGIIEATLKTALMMAVKRQLDKAIGSNSTPIVIWSTFLFADSMSQAQKYGSNLIASSTRGRQEGVGFAPDTALAPGDDGLTARLAASAKKDLEKRVNPVSKSTIGQFGSVNEMGQADVFDPDSPNFAGYFALYKRENNRSLAVDIASAAEKKEKETVFSKFAEQTGAGYETEPGTNPGIVAGAKIESTLLPVKRAYLAKDWNEIVAAMSMKLVSGALQSASKSVVKKAESASKDFIDNANRDASSVYKNTY